MREWHREPSALPEGMSMPPETQELLGIPKHGWEALRESPVPSSMQWLGGS